MMKTNNDKKCNDIVIVFNVWTQVLIGLQSDLLYKLMKIGPLVDSNDQKPLSVEGKVF